MTELDVQFAVYNHRAMIQPCPIIIPNIYYFSWESDVLFVTKSMCLYEYEIKLTKSDFRADFKKEFRHHRLANKVMGYPAEFWYVCPPDIIPVDEVPEYAGLAHVAPYKGLYMSEFPNTLSVIKKAPRLSGHEKMPKGRLMEMLYKMSHRYWHHMNRNGIPEPICTEE